METVDGRNDFFIRWTAERGKLQHTLQCAARNLISNKWNAHAQHNMSVINKANKKCFVSTCEKKQLPDPSQHWVLHACDDLWHVLLVTGTNGQTERGFIILFFILILKFYI